MQPIGSFDLADDDSTRNSPWLVSIGSDFRQASVAARERLAFGGEALPRALLDLRSVGGEGLILSTCNRTEVYAVVEAPCSAVAARELRRYLAVACGAAIEELRQATTERHGRDAARHLFRVASGLESLVVGEPQILGQLRSSLAAAHAAGATGPVLSRLATDALRVGKRARTVTGIARNRLSVPHAAVETAARLLGGIEGRSALVVGAGEMGTLTARLLRAAGIGDLVIANRTLARAEAVAAACGARAIRLSGIPAELARVDVAFGAAGVAAGAHLVAADALDGSEGNREALLFVDLGVPRTFDPALDERPGIRLLDVDELHASTTGLRERYGHELTRAEELVEQATAAYMEWWRARAAVPAISALRGHAEAIRRTELDRALARLGHLGPRDREVVAALSVGLVNKLLHGPITRMQDGDGQAFAIAAARALFGAEEHEAQEHRPGDELEPRRQIA
jgi:glutamyl-tRNA reductase